MHRIPVLACLALAFPLNLWAQPAEQLARVKVSAIECSSNLGDVDGKRKKLTAAELKTDSAVNAK